MNNKRGNYKKSFSPRQSGIIIFVLGLAVIIGAYFIFIVCQDESVNQNEKITVYANYKESSSVNQVNTKIYSNTDYGFKVEYPEDWQVKTSHTGEGSNEISYVNLSSGDKNVDISIMADSFEGIVRNSISITKESKLEVNGLEAVRLEGGSAKDGSLVNMVIIKKQGQLYSIRGIGPDFEEILGSFEIL